MKTPWVIFAKTCQAPKPHLLLSLRPVVQQISPLEAEAIREDGSNLFQHGIFNPGPAGSHGLFWRQPQLFCKTRFSQENMGGSSNNECLNVFFSTWENFLHT